MPDPVPTAAQRLLLAADRLFGRVFGERCNPLHHLGTISYWLFWLIVASGLYLYAFYRTSIDGAYASVEQITNGQWYIGGVMRSVHRYASAALVLTMWLHLLRHAVFGRHRGLGAFSWLTGIALLWFAHASGVNGYMLPWDRLAQYVAVATAEWFDILPVFNGILIRNFVSQESLSDRLFSLLSFLHIGLPLLMLAALWIHTQAVPQSRTMPPRPLAAGVAVTLLALAGVAPVVSQGAGTLDQVATRLDLDWFYLALYPLLDRWSPLGVWALVGGATVLLAVMPWLPPRRGRGAVAYAVTFRPMGKTVSVRPGESLLDAGLRAGLRLRFECRNGACGACAAQLVSGEADPGAFQPHALTQRQRATGRLLLCCARATTPLVVDVSESAVAAGDLAPAGAASWHAAVVEQLEPLEPGLIRMTLRLVDGASISFAEGQHIDVLLEDGARRSYTFIANGREVDRFELKIHRVPGGRFTTRVFESMRPGDPLHFEGPLGQATLPAPLAATVVTRMRPAVTSDPGPAD